MAIELRDQFALAALNMVRVKGSDANQIARAAYKLADAMLRARLIGVPDLSRLRWPKGSGASRVSLKPKATDEQFPLILKMKSQGMTNKEIADTLKINGQSVNGVLAVYERKIASFVGKKKLERYKK